MVGDRCKKQQQQKQYKKTTENKEKRQRKPILMSQADRVKWAKLINCCYHMSSLFQFQGFAKNP